MMKYDPFSASWTQSGQVRLEKPARANHPIWRGVGVAAQLLLTGESGGFVSDGGNFGTFTSRSGSVITVRSNEVLLEGQTPDAVQELELLLAAANG